MSAKPAIRVDGLSKKYILGQLSRPYCTLRHVIQDFVQAPFRKTRKEESAASEFWALRDVSFEIPQGGVVGIIGRNGAGKSTLLKILSRITEPTEGRIGINGRLASLLEVGTGFHPELSGRENIFLNGAILGMKRAEVRAKFDEIIAFAGVEKFLETPVKRYSSGMYVRLAFAVAAHLEPEILVVDEVLAVGDSEFQKKCLGKMQEVTKGGRTVLFVSHNLSAVEALCQTGIYLKSGRMVTMDTTKKVLELYKNDMAGPAMTQAQQHARSGTGTHRVDSIEPAQRSFAAREPISFKVRIRRYQDEAPFNFSLHVHNEWGAEIYAITTEHLDDGLRRQGDQEFELVIDSPWLAPGDYSAEVFLYAGGIIDHWPQACDFQVGDDVAKFGYSHVTPSKEKAILPAFQILPSCTEQ